MNKFNAKKTIIDGIKFDSKLEAQFYEILKPHIIQLQPSFELQPSYVTSDGVKVRNIVYKADFMIQLDNKQIVIDAKGVETDVFKIKAKMLKYHYPDLEFYTIKNVKELNKIISNI